MKRGKYLETVLDVLDEELGQMGVDDDYEVYGCKSTNVDDESVMLLVDFPNDVTRAFEFPYDDELDDEEDVKGAYISSDARRQIHRAILEDAAKRHVTINELSRREEVDDFDEEEEYDEDYDYDDEHPFD